MTILVTGGAGFIGAHFIRDWLAGSDEPVINLDKLTYAADLSSLALFENDPRYHFIQGDILDKPLVCELLNSFKPRAIVHFAAESHVDRSIHSPDDFLQTNVMGTHSLLEAALAFSKKSPIRFHHVSTDEVYGSLNPQDPPFTENSPYRPNSPYSATKAASDHLVRAYHHTYGLDTVTTHCSNNYGPFQCREKFIPTLIHHALEGKNLPIYGDGLNVRDWLYVGDHCAALRLVLEKGRSGETYAIGGNNERSNLDVVNLICEILDQHIPRTDGQSYQEQIAFVSDRLGHDRRYAINADKIRTELGWKAEYDFERGLLKTVLS